MLAQNETAGSSSDADAHIEIIEASSEQHYRHAAQLIREFVSWCHARYAHRPGFVDSHFPKDDFEQELQNLHNKFAPPNATLLVAYVDGNAAGVVGYTKLNHDMCEMKRFYLAPKYQGLGLGRRLASALMSRAREAGFKHMCLETADLHTEAQRLYRKLGFVRTELFTRPPPEMRPFILAYKRVL